MTALMALQFKLMWRGLPWFAKTVWVLGLIAVSVTLSKTGPTDETFTTGTAIPLGILLLGISMAVATAESMSWHVPLPHDSRVWARLGVLALTGLVITSSILLAMAAFKVEPKVDWVTLALSLWTCWIGAGLLLLFVADWLRTIHPMLGLLGTLAGGAPGIAMACYHLVEKLPWEILFAELGVTAVVFGLSLLKNRDEDLPRKEPMASAEKVTATAKVEHTASLVPVMWSGPFRYRITWIFLSGMLILSLLPSLMLLSLYSVIFLILGFQGALTYWSPFRATPLSRPKAFLMLTAPVLAVWALTTAVQSVAIRYWGDVLPIQDLHGETSAEKAAAKISTAYRKAYNLNVPAAEVLALRGDGGDRSWLQEVERRWRGEVSARQIRWRVLISTATLLCALLSLVGSLPGRWPAWIRHVVSGGAMLVPMLVMVLESVEVKLTQRLSEPFRALLYDRPLILAALCGGICAVLYLRHLRIFSTGEMISGAAPNP